MKRYLTFAGDFCYPAGGWDDLAGSANTIEEAIQLSEAKRLRLGELDQNSWWWHVVDSTSGLKVRNYRDPL